MLMMFLRQCLYAGDVSWFPIHTCAAEPTSTQAWIYVLDSGARTVENMTDLLLRPTIQQFHHRAYFEVAAITHVGSLFAYGNVRYDLRDLPAHACACSPSSCSDA